MEDDGKRLAPGDVVAGRYRVEGVLGEGGFGAVYRATQLNLDRPVALKMLLPEALGNEEAFARFRREAELAQRLQHPNTVRLYDFGETDDGLPFIAWELLLGRPLDALLRDERVLGPARVARIAAQILKALMEAHALGIVHRDIKPSNVFLCEFSGEREFVKVLDFGIAKNTRGKAITMVGSILGTPSYMAPEQLKGAEVSPASDVYALGLLMAEALSGQSAYGAATGATLIMAQLSDTPAVMPPSVTGSPLGPIVLRAIQKRPAARFPDAAAMMAQLEPVLASLAPRPAAAAPSFASAPTVLAYSAPGGQVVVHPPASAAAPTSPASVAVPVAPVPSQPRFQSTVPMWRPAAVAPGPVQGGPASTAGPRLTFGAPALPVPQAAAAPLSGPLSRPLAATPSDRRNLVVGLFAGAVFVLMSLIVVVLVSWAFKHAEHEGHGAEGAPRKPLRSP
jgi:serine/threonine protein kinase